MPLKFFYWHDFFQVVPEVVAALRGLSISQEELTAAKKALSVEHSEAMHKPHSIVEALGVQAMNGGGDDIETLMTMVSVSDVTVRSFTTMCKFQDFSVAQIFREINVRDFRYSKLLF